MRLPRIALLALLMVLLPSAAMAHTLSVSHVDIQVAEDGKHSTVELDLALRDIALTLPLDADHDERVTWGEVLAMRAPIEAMVHAGFALSTDAGPCALAVTRLALRRYDDGTYATLVLNANCPRARKLRVDYNLFLAQDPQHRALITVRRGDTVTTGIARADVTRVEIAPGTGHPFADFVREGIHHILIGYDHLAFLISLLLPAALLLRGRTWQPSPSFRASLGHVLGIITAFTLAHSITLSLAALGWVRPASRWVEVAIAASVLLAALNNIRPVMSRRLWMVAFGFGLVHGFGFAGALLELGLPRGARLAALVGFNVGVELGQLTVVALLLPVLFVLRRKHWYARWAMPLASLAIAMLATYWLFWRLVASAA
ncbi:HupE/UreJ family protein [soil metagenome]